MFYVTWGGGGGGVLKGSTKTFEAAQNGIRMTRNSNEDLPKSNLELSCQPAKSPEP